MWRDKQLMMWHSEHKFCVHQQELWRRGTVHAALLAQHAALGC